MFDSQEGEFAYSIRRRRSVAGEVMWCWEIRHRLTREVSGRGVSARSHHHAKTAALNAIFLASRIRPRPH